MYNSYMSKLIVACSWCKEEFLREEFYVKRVKTGVFCSKECFKASRATLRKFNCLLCGNVFEDYPNKQRKYCNRSCSVSATNVSRKVEKHCLECGATTANKKFCTRSCQHEYNYKEYIARWQSGKETGVLRNGIETSTILKKYLIRKYGNKCMKCGWCEVHSITKKVPITLDHINGNSMDNSEENLRLLCPNCHSLTPTFGALNKGNGRKARYAKMM